MPPASCIRRDVLHLLHLRRALEHHVLEEVREPGAAFRLDAEADVVHDLDQRHRRGVVLADHHLQAVRQREVVHRHLEALGRPGVAVATITRAASITKCGLGILVTVRGRYGPIRNCRRTNAFNGFLPSSRRIAGSQDARDPGQRRLGLGRGPQVAVEQHVAAHPEHAIGRPRAVAQLRGRRRRIAGRPSPMMTGATARCRRSSRFASRNADTVTPPPSTNTRAQPRSRSTRSSAAGAPPGPSPATRDLRRGAHPRLAARRRALRDRRTASAPRRRKTRDSACDQPPRRIENHPQRVGTRHMPRRQLRIVGRHGSGADDHRVAERAQPVQVHDVLVAGDELRVAGLRRDETVEALPEMADGDRARRRGAADRQVEVEDMSARIAGGQSRDFQPRPGRQTSTASIALALTVIRRPSRKANVWFRRSPSTTRRTRPRPLPDPRPRPPWTPGGVHTFL